MTRMQKWSRVLVCTVAPIITMLLINSCGDESPRYSDVRTSDNQESKPPIPTDPLLLEIQDMETRAKRDSVIDRTVGLRLLRAYQTYYNQHPKDSLGRAYLFEAAQVADALGKYDKAIELLTNFHDGSTDVKKRAEALYLMGFIYDAHMHKDKEAIATYNRVIELYPNSTWAEQSKSALHLVGKSDEELLKFLKEKNANPS